VSAETFTTQLQKQKLLHREKKECAPIAKLRVVETRSLNKMGTREHQEYEAESKTVVDIWHGKKVS